MHSDWAAFNLGYSPESGGGLLMVGSRGLVPHSVTSYIESTPEITTKSSLRSPSEAKVTQQIVESDIANHGAQQP